jgi:heavy metal sensor kinase
VKLFRTIKFRLTLWYLGVIVVLLFVFGGIAYVMLSDDLQNDSDALLRSRAIAVHDRLAAGETDVADERLETQLHEAILIYNPGGTLLKRYGAGIEFAGIDDFARRAYGGQGSFTTVTATNGEEVRFYAAAFDIGTGNQIAILVGRSRAWINDETGTMREILSLSGLIVIIMAGAGGLLLASRALRPVDDIIRSAQEIEGSDLSRRINVRSEDELGRLASTLNRMIERLEASFNHQRQFTADVSHELRTPLAVIEAESTLALSRDRTPDEYKKSLELISQESAYMSSLIDKVLYFARSNAVTEQLNFEEINLGALLTELSSDVKVLANEKDILCEVALPEDIIVKGDKMKLRQLFVSILENAVSYTPVGGKISVNATKTINMAKIDISDTGMGIPPENLPHIFERYYRARQAQSEMEAGAGLGLAIAKTIVEIHGGCIEVDSEVDKGSIFHVMLPLAN